MLLSANPVFLATCRMRMVRRGKAISVVITVSFVDGNGIIPHHAFGWSHEPRLVFLAEVPGGEGCLGARDGLLCRWRPWIAHHAFDRSHEPRLAFLARVRRVKVVSVLTTVSFVEGDLTMTHHAFDRSHEPGWCNHHLITLETALILARLEYRAGPAIHSPLCPSRQAN
jgi:hypothetical protein